jgi:putative SOS response-associated peptidase YedK
MCGRYAQTASREALTALLGAIAADEFPPRFNISPTQNVPVVLIESGRRLLALHRWGLVPAFAADPRAVPLMFNARAETLAQKPAFRTALQRRRCLVPADGWYEWRTISRFKQPYLVRRPDRAPFMFAGLWESWKGSDGTELRSVAIVTVTASPDLALVHDRMPAVLPQESWEAWLDVRVDGRSLALRGLHPSPVGTFEAVAVNARVNQAANDGPEVQEPAVAHHEPPPLGEDAQPRLI